MIEQDKIQIAIELVAAWLGNNEAHILITKEAEATWLAAFEWADALERVLKERANGR